MSNVTGEYYKKYQEEKNYRLRLLKSLVEYAIAHMDQEEANSLKQDYDKFMKIGFELDREANIDFAGDCFMRKKRYQIGGSFEKNDIMFETDIIDFDGEAEDSSPLGELKNNYLGKILELRILHQAIKKKTEPFKGQQINWFESEMPVEKNPGYQKTVNDFFKRQDLDHTRICFIREMLSRMSLWNGAPEITLKRFEEKMIWDGIAFWLNSDILFGGICAYSEHGEKIWEKYHGYFDALFLTDTACDIQKEAARRINIKQLNAYKDLKTALIIGGEKTEDTMRKILKEMNTCIELIEKETGWTYTNRTHRYRGKKYSCIAFTGRQNYRFNNDTDCPVRSGRNIIFDETVVEIGKQNPNPSEEEIQFRESAGFLLEKLEELDLQRKEIIFSAYRKKKPRFKKDDAILEYYSNVSREIESENSRLASSFQETADEFVDISNYNVDILPTLLNEIESSTDLNETLASYESIFEDKNYLKELLYLASLYSIKAYMFLELYVANYEDGKENGSWLLENKLKIKTLKKAALQKTEL